jgi:protein involved in sex pheromone biosynthesis
LRLPRPEGFCFTDGQLLDRKTLRVCLDKKTKSAKIVIFGLNLSEEKRTITVVMATIQHTFTLSPWDEDAAVYPVK